MEQKHLSTLLFAFVIAVAIREISADEPEKLVGGYDVPIRRYPYMASIRLNNNHICGGAIVRDNFILTAAHCLQPFVSRIPIMTVVTGATSIKHGGNTHRVSQLFYHPQFRADPKMGSGYDIGLIKLADNIQFNEDQKPIQLPVTELPPGVTVEITAWGATSHPHGALSVNLQKLDLPTISSDTCQRYHTQRITFTQFCTLKAPGQGTCGGDSGSPLAFNGFIVGVVSNGIPCARGIPDVHTNVYQMREFIDDIISM